MKVTEFLSIGALAGLLLGCAQAEITQPPITVTPNVAANAIGIDVYARNGRGAILYPPFGGKIRFRSELSAN